MSLRLNNLTVSYQRHPAVHHVSGQFAPGRATAIFGPNGAGKSTLLKTMMGLLKPDSGSVELAGFARRDIAYLPQQSEIDRSLPVSVSDLVATGLWHSTGLFGQVTHAGRGRVADALAAVGLKDFAARPINALSSGQFQRVLFARILTQDARLILLDEPFNAVDARTTFDLLELIRHWQEEGRTVIAVLHDYEQVRAYFPHTLLLAREVVAWGETASVLTDDNLRRAAQTAAHWQDRAPVCTVSGEGTA
ncbi:ABC-type Mn2+/Zn2+ transport system, ATPase component [Gulbenkiania indica]|uniref:ABC-type Mn2+/Zn2+ transport system, ATPase component n=2 Tax=Gulbenkiania TaxID=397456 RepID=A0A0K6GZW9_9NEIS|nr:ABC transporter ATP-binding protein [Gulbenkiania indica]TCW31531.1 zinc/manganese transport system ATP-binding protein [Gulbenkiania mobilis]CUA84287.1 ABC-type Mn2+/Zn2+ transport system, ATPase component [Gulbenkiania indica]